MTARGGSKDRRRRSEGSVPRIDDDASKPRRRTRKSVPEYGATGSEPGLSSSHPTPSEAFPEASEGSRPPPAGAPDAALRRLELVLRALPDKELMALVGRLGIRIDAKKRIDCPAQVARALARLPDVREPGRLPPIGAELLRRIVEANGSLEVTSLPAGLEVLVRRGIVFARGAAGAVELVMPTALLVQLKTWEGEDPRSLRALLSEAPFETASAIASHYLGRPATPPIALSLEPAWEALGNPDVLLSEVERVSHQERRLLDQLEQVGGEVDTQELMDLEREPMRVRGAYGVAAGRRGAAFSLEKRGLLFPLHPNRYVIPTEVAAIIGADRRRAAEERRLEIQRHVVEDDHLPRRARFSADPAPLALAMAIAVREGSWELRPGVGTPRSHVARLAQRFGREQEATALVVALSRAIGLWEPGGVGIAAPPGSLSVEQLSAVLFETWRRGGAWDEARPDSEMLRVAPEHRDSSPVGVLREMVVDALANLGHDQWVPYAALITYIQNDPRAAGMNRLLSRWAKRVALPTPSEIDITNRVLLESLPTLGVVDVGGADMETASGSGELKTLALRLTARGRELTARACRPGPKDDEQALRLAHASSAARRAASADIEGRRVRVGPTARVAEATELGAFADIAAVDPLLELEVSAAAVARGLALGISASEMRAGIEALTPLSDELRLALDEAGTVVGRGTLAPASAFLWIDDPEVREMLRSMPPLLDTFVDPSPPGGLLVAAGVDPEKLVRRCRALGVEVEVEEGVLRVRSSTMPPPKRSETNRRRISWRPTPARGEKDNLG